MTRNRKILLGALATVALPLVAVPTVGALLPLEHEASREVALGSTPAQVWSLISNRKESAGWRPEVASVEREQDRDGKPVYRETGSWGTIRYLVADEKPNQRLVTRIVDHEDFGGRWVYEITAAPQGCTLKITEQGEIYSPVFRFFAHFVFGYEGTLEAYLQAVQTKLG